MPPPIQKHPWKSASLSIKAAEMECFAREFSPSLARIAFSSILPVQGFHSLPACVVPILPAHGQLAVALCLGLHAHAAKPARTPRIGRLVADGVLVAPIAGHGATDLVHLAERLGKKGPSAGALLDDFQSPPGAFGMLFLAENSNGVDGRPVLPLQLFDRLFQSFQAGVVFSVGHYKQHFFLQLRVPS